MLYCITCTCECDSAGAGEDSCVGRGTLNGTVRIGAVWDMSSGYIGRCRVEL